MIQRDIERSRNQILITTLFLSFITQPTIVSISFILERMKYHFNVKIYIFSRLQDKTKENERW